MREYVFLYKDKDSDGRDCVKYIKSDPMRFECSHYFGGINLNGACFSTDFNYEKSNYDDVMTILTRKEFERLIRFNDEIGKLGYGIVQGDDRYKAGLALIEEVKPIFEKLNSEGNAMLFEKIVEEETEYLMEEYSLSRMMFRRYSTATDWITGTEGLYPAFSTLLMSVRKRRRSLSDM